MNKYTKRNKKTKIRQVAATEIEEPKKETEYSKAKKNWRNCILKKKKRIEERAKTKKEQNLARLYQDQKIKKKNLQEDITTQKIIMDIKNTAEKKKLDEDAIAKNLIMDMNTIVERERIIEDEQISYSKAVEDLKYEEDKGLEEIEYLEERYEIFKPLKWYDDNYKERKK